MIQILDNLKVPEFTDDATCDDTTCECHEEEFLGYALDDEVTFENDKGEIDVGHVVSVRFTKGGVWYDIIDHLAVVTYNVHECLVELV